MNAALDDPCATSTRYASDLISTQRIARVNTDADNVAGLQGSGIDCFQRFVYEDRVACNSRRRRSQDEQPARGDDSSAKGIIARIYEMNAHRSEPFLERVQGTKVSAIAVLRSGPGEVLAPLGTGSELAGLFCDHTLRARQTSVSRSEASCTARPTSSSTQPAVSRFQQLKTETAHRTAYHRLGPIAPGEPMREPDAGQEAQSPRSR